MYIIYCKTTDEETERDTKEEAILAAQEMLKDQVLDDLTLEGEVIIFEPILVVRGKVDVSFELDTYKPVVGGYVGKISLAELDLQEDEKSKDDDTDLSPAKSV